MFIPNNSIGYCLINHQRIGLLMSEELEKIRAIADFQFGPGAGKALFPEGTWIEYSKNTGRPRHIFHKGKMIANFRPNNAVFTITIAGAERLNSLQGFNDYVVVVDNVVEFIEKGKNLFAKHVLEAGVGIKPGNEVIIRDNSGKVLAVGKAILNTKEMKHFKKGVAVKVRRGRERHI
jgi:predicted RNA-binding protein (TIGR00451 family)